MTTTSQLALGEKQRNEHYVQDHEDITALHVSDSVEFDNADTDCLDVASNSAEIEHLQAQVADLSDKVTELQDKYEKSSFRLENIKDDNDLVHFYTGSILYLLFIKQF